MIAILTLAILAVVVTVTVRVWSRLGRSDRDTY
jgi:hypothetical protein